MKNMKMSRNIVLIICCVLMSTAICNGDTVRKFKSNINDIKSPFYATITFELSRKGRKPVILESHVWFENPKLYRHEIMNSPGPGLTTYSFRSCNVLYSATAKLNNIQEPKWGAVQHSGWERMF